MRRKGWKWMLLGAALAVVVLYGFEFSTAGIERIYGSLEQPASSTAPVEEQPLANVREETVEPEQEVMTETERRIIELEKEIALLKQMTSTEQKTVIEPLAPSAEQLQEEEPLIILLEPNDATVNKLADSASTVLQSASNGGIKFIGSLFEGFIK